jgi:hypothetical protein
MEIQKAGETKDLPQQINNGSSVKKWHHGLVWLYVKYFTRLIYAN